jgi:hypothetical protein
MSRVLAGAHFIPRHVRRSLAWRDASDNARKVLIALAGRFSGNNNGLLSFSMYDGNALGLSDAETELALIELERVGLIESRPEGDRQ